MYRAGQFLIEPSAFLGWFNTFGIAAVSVMIFSLFMLRANYILRLSPGFTPEMFGVGLMVGGALSIVATLLLTTTSLIFLGNVLSFTGKDVNQDRARVAGIDQVRYLSIRPNSALIHIGARGIGTVSRSKAGQVAIVCGILLLVVGAGYAFTLLKLSFWGSFAAMSAGVGLPEELTKAAAGLLVLYLLFDTKSLSQTQFRRAVLAAFGIAGLGFGAGEALKYFGVYAHEHAGVFWYGVRAVWCVTLHGAWTLLVGAMLANSLPQDPKALENKKAETFFMVLLASVPMAIVHGLYNACCEHAEVLSPWTVGLISILVARAVIEGFMVEKPEEPLLAQQPS